MLEAWLDLKEDLYIAGPTSASSPIEARWGGRVQGTAYFFVAKLSRYDGWRFSH